MACSIEENEFNGIKLDFIQSIFCLLFAGVNSLPYSFRSTRATAVKKIVNWRIFLDVRPTSQKLLLRLVNCRENLSSNLED